MTVVGKRNVRREKLTTYDILKTRVQFCHIVMPRVDHRNLPINTRDHPPSWLSNLTPPPSHPPQFSISQTHRSHTCKLAAVTSKTVSTSRIPGDCPQSRYEVKSAYRHRLFLRWNPSDSER